MIMCIKQGLWLPQKPKTENYFTTFPLDYFIRWMTQVFIFHIDLTLMVAMVTENGRENGIFSILAGFGGHFL